MSVATHPQINLHDNSLSGARAWFAQNGLSRPRDGAVLAGVSASFARRYQVHPLVARLTAITSVLVLTPLVYVAAWILMPKEATIAPATAR